MASMARVKNNKKFAHFIKYISKVAICLIVLTFFISLAPNEILVAEFTDPGWTPLFINAKALILEVGGALTHGAVVAREYGIPAVVGVREALNKLKTGQNVRVDGNRGIIELI